MNNYFHHRRLIFKAVNECLEGLNKNKNYKTLLGNLIYTEDDNGIKQWFLLIDEINEEAFFELSLVLARYIGLYDIKSYYQLSHYLRNCVILDYYEPKK